MIQSLVSFIVHTCMLVYVHSCNAQRAATEGTSIKHWVAFSPINIFWLKVVAALVYTTKTQLSMHAVHSRVYMQSYIRMDVHTLSACIHTQHTQKPAPYYCFYYCIIAEVVERVFPCKPIHAKCHSCSGKGSKWYTENCRQPMLQWS